MNKLLLLSALILTACGENGSHTPTFAVPAPPSLPTSTPSSLPSTLPTPSCKPVESSWQTPTVPQTKLLGVYIGPPTSGPIYTLDLSLLQTGVNDFKYDATHVCSYNITKLTNSYRIESFQGCNPGVIPPGHPANEQCDYCPDAYTTGHTFNFTSTCNGLIITDTQTNQIISYQ